MMRRRKFVGATASPDPEAGMSYADRVSHTLNGGRCLVYWLLLPPEANAQRHFADETGPSGNYLVRLLASFMRLLFGAKSPRT